MYRTTGSIVTVVALYISAFVPNNLPARDDGRYANSPLKQWFDRLASGKGLCCSFADGVSVEDIDSNCGRRRAYPSRRGVSKRRGPDKPHGGAGRPHRDHRAELCALAGRARCARRVRICRRSRVAQSRRSQRAPVLLPRLLGVGGINHGRFFDASPRREILHGLRPHGLRPRRDPRRGDGAPSTTQFLDSPRQRFCVRQPRHYSGLRSSHRYR